jgi:hypothetical protein
MVSEVIEKTDFVSQFEYLVHCCLHQIGWKHIPAEWKDHPSSSMYYVKNKPKITIERTNYTS